jgi:P4 family phage/plasmid primase-like protien
MKLHYFKSKDSAKKKLGTTNKIICNRNIFQYFLLDDYAQFIELIKSVKLKNFYEFIPINIPVPLYFDIDIKRDSVYFQNSDEIIELLLNTVSSMQQFSSYTPRRLILESHNTEKKSYHIILQFINREDAFVLFENVQALKTLIKDIDFDRNVVDDSVYREGLFRTLYSSKRGEDRPLVKSSTSNDFEDIYSLVGYYHTLPHVIHQLQTETETDQTIELNDSNITVNIPEDLSETDKEFIKKFVHKEYHHSPNKIRDIFIDKEYNCIIVALHERYCHNLSREHRSNNQYIVIDTTSSKQKCHDPECSEHKYNDIKLENYPKELNEILKKCLKVNKHELELIDKAIVECRNYITENYDAHVEHVTFDSKEMIFRGNLSNQALISVLNGTCQQCKIEHQISNTGYCLKCIVCQSVFPKKQIIPVDPKFKNINSFWANYQIGGTINNIINIYNNTEDFSCDVQLDANIIKDKKILKIINECLDGHKVTKLAELMHNIYKDYVFTGNDWYFFNSHKWVHDQKSLNFKLHTLELCTTFNKIKAYYEDKPADPQAQSIIKNIKKLITNINKPTLKDEILKDAQLFYVDDEFFKKLNSKNHLIPFKNGVYDLLNKEFRKTKKEDYINLTTGFNYNKKVDNREVHTFINNILPNAAIRDYVLKKLSECLNADIPNTNFLMFIGDGANGKSQLLNLMKATIGELGEKVEVTLLTRKRNNANEANTEKIKLMSKRFAFLSEPEDGEKINIGLLKELTSSEEIVARGLYQDSVSFVMEAKLFLACNELPEIKGEDTALWRRIRVIDFPSRFVDEPKEENEYMIDRTLPSRMREDMSWRQTFMNILIDYYFKTIPEPIEVKVRTNAYREENSAIYSWMEENVVFKQDAILQAKTLFDVIGSSLNTKFSNKKKAQLKDEVQKWIKEKHPTINHKFQDNNSFNNTKYRGWLHLAINEDDSDSEV